MSLRQLVVRLLVAIAVFALLIQAIPVERRNAAVTSNVEAPPAVASILRRACYDCHSNETIWPSYSRVAPVSWLVARDVHEGRRHLDFSTWNRYDAVTRRRMLDRAAEEVANGDMPPVYYVWMHPAARLSDADRAALKAWFARP